MFLHSAACIRLSGALSSTRDMPLHLNGFFSIDEIMTLKPEAGLCAAEAFHDENLDSSYSPGELPNTIFLSASRNSPSGV